MQNEIIYIPNTKIFNLEGRGGFIALTILDKRIPLNNIEALGKPFQVITKRKVDRTNPFSETSEFKELLNPFSPLEMYLRQAEIEYTLSRKEDNMSQNLGLYAGESLKVSSLNSIGDKKNEYSLNIVPCQFYLIKDKI